MKQIKLIRPHVHAGVGYSAGDVIDVTAADAVYLIRHQIGTAVKSAGKNTDKNADKAEQQPPEIEQTETTGSNADTVRLTAKPTNSNEENNNGTR